MKFRGKADTDKNIAGLWIIYRPYGRSRPKCSPDGLHNNNNNNNNNAIGGLGGRHKKITINGHFRKWSISSECVTILFSP